MIYGGQASLEDFEFERVIGEGNFSKVYAGKRDGVRYAVKSADSCEIRRVQKELELLMEKHCLLRANPHVYRDATRSGLCNKIIENVEPTHHGAEHIVKLYHTFKDGEQVVFVTELCDGQELWDHVKGMGMTDEYQLRCVMGQICTAVDYLHSLGIVHRDLKAENVVVNGNLKDVKLIDFGSAMDLSFDPEKTLAGNSRQGRRPFRYFVGTPNYMAPEARANLSSASCPVDIWALGCLTYQLSTGCSPFQAPSEFLIFARASFLELDIPCFMSLECERFIRSLLIGNADGRPSLPSILRFPYLDFERCPCDCTDLNAAGPVKREIRNLWTFWVSRALEIINRQRETGKSADIDWIGHVWPGRSRLAESNGGGALESSLELWETNIFSAGCAGWKEMFETLGEKSSVFTEKSSVFTEKCVQLAATRNSEDIYHLMKQGDYRELLDIFARIVFDGLRKVCLFDRQDNYYEELAQKWLLRIPGRNGFSEFPA